MQDSNKKSKREFQCRDYLWDMFEQMSKELSCSVDYLINESMRQYAKSRGQGTSQILSPTLASQQLASANVATGQMMAMNPQSMLGARGIQPTLLGSQGLGQQGALPPPPGMSQEMAAQSLQGFGSSPNAYAVPPAQQAPQLQSSPQFQHPQQAQPSAPPPLFSPLQPSAPQFAAPQLPGTQGPISVNRGTVPPPLPTAQGMGGGPPALGQPPSLGHQSAAPRPHVQLPPLVAIYQGQRFPVQKEEFIIGRGSKTTDLPIKDGNISRRHAAVVWQNGAFYMKDLGSTNGVEFQGRRVDGKRIEEGDSYLLCDHEVRFTYR